MMSTFRNSFAECDGFTEELVEGRIFKDKTDRELIEIRKDLERIKESFKYV